MIVNKALLANLAALVMIAIGWFLAEPYRSYLLSTGLFAFSGAITNWLAIHMLFEKVPGFYGSGVIPARFDEFKVAIKTLLMEQFFNQSSFRKFFEESDELVNALDSQVKASIKTLNLDKAFESLLDVIMASSFGAMLAMIGGRDALIKLKDPFVEKMRSYLEEVMNRESFRARLQSAVSQSIGSDGLRDRLEELIEQRLNQMTPEMVKEIVQKMIKKHLGWLVVWGCVFGGMIGLLVSVSGSF